MQRYESPVNQHFQTEHYSPFPPVLFIQILFIYWTGNVLKLFITSLPGNENTSSNSAVLKMFRQSPWGQGGSVFLHLHSPLTKGCKCQLLFVSTPPVKVLAAATTDIFVMLNPQSVSSLSTSISTTEASSKLILTFHWCQFLLEMICDRYSGIYWLVLTVPVSQALCRAAIPNWPAFHLVNFLLQWPL